jgi:hypothetical protein
MNGFGHLPSKSDQNTFVFYANASGSASGSFQAWSIPEHAAFLHFTVIGGGGGGGGGSGGTGLTVGRNGGGGGAPGGLVAVSIPTILLPKTLYLQIGKGGSGGTGSINNAQGQTGESGTISYVCLYPEFNPGSVLIQSSNTAPGGGGGGAFTGGGAGVAITIADTTNLKWLGIVGNTVAQTPGTSVQAGTGNGGVSVTYSGLLTGGASGGGKIDNTNNGTAGGSITMTSINSYVTTALNGGAGGINPAAGGDGNNGLFSWRPFIATGGAGGGGGSISAVGGNGGSGAYGCGGGGGGTSGVGLTGGAGGPGGDGLIIISVS